MSKRRYLHEDSALYSCIIANVRTLLVLKIWLYFDRCRRGSTRFVAWWIV